MSDVIKMTKTQISNLPNGDVLVLRRNSEGDPTECVGVDGSFFEIIEHRPAPLKEGDRVNYEGITANPGTIIHIHGYEAWVKWDTSLSRVVDLHILRRIP